MSFYIAVIEGYMVSNFLSVIVFISLSGGTVSYKCYCCISIISDLLEYLLESNVVPKLFYNF